jgi:hypothetical protein
VECIEQFFQLLVHPCGSGIDNGDHLRLDRKECTTYSRYIRFFFVRYHDDTGESA